MYSSIQNYICNRGIKAMKGIWGLIDEICIYNRY